jgi:hypothetical protein
MADETAVLGTGLDTVALRQFGRCERYQADGQLFFNWRAKAAPKHARCKHQNRRIAHQRLWRLEVRPQTPLVLIRTRARHGPVTLGSECCFCALHVGMPSKVGSSLLEMEVRFIGATTAIGSVDSVLLGFQTRSTVSWLSLSDKSPKYFLQSVLQPAPDPAFRVLVESACNFIWKSHIAQILVSLRMALRAMHLDDTSLLVYISVGYGVVFSRRRIHEAICMRYHAIAACLTDGYQMRSDAGRKRGVEFGEWDEWFQFIGAWIASPWFSERNMLNWDEGYKITCQLLILIALVLWDLRDSVPPMTFGPYLYEKHWWLVRPLNVRFLAALVQHGTRMLGDSVTFLLGQAVISLTSIALAVGFLRHWALAPFWRRFLYVQLADRRSF